MPLLGCNFKIDTPYVVVFLASMFEIVSKNVMVIYLLMMTWSRD